MPNRNYWEKIEKYVTDPDICYVKKEEEKFMLYQVAALLKKGDKELMLIAPVDIIARNEEKAKEKFLIDYSSIIKTKKLDGKNLELDDLEIFVHPFG